MIEELKHKLQAYRDKGRRQQESRDKALKKLERLRRGSQAFYATETGREQIKWMDEYEAGLLVNAITSNDPQVRLSSLDQAKGLQAFRAYIETLTKKD